MNTNVSTADMLAVVDKAVKRATYKWPILRLKQNREETRGTLLLIADQMAEKFDGEYWNSTFEAYALDGLIKHAYNCARGFLSGLSASRHYLNVFAEESHTYGSVELNTEIHSGGEVAGALVDAVSAETSAEVREELADLDDDDREILLATCGEGVQPQDLAAEFGGGITRQAVTGRRDALIRRLRRNERLRDINGERFGSDKLSIDYGHKAPAPLSRFRVAATSPASLMSHSRAGHWLTYSLDREPYPVDAATRGAAVSPDQLAAHLCHRAVASAPASPSVLAPPDGRNWGLCSDVAGTRGSPLRAFVGDSSAPPVCRAGLERASTLYGLNAEAGNRSRHFSDGRCRSPGALRCVSKATLASGPGNDWHADADRHFRDLGGTGDAGELRPCRGTAELIARRSRGVQVRLLGIPQAARAAPPS